MTKLIALLLTSTLLYSCISYGNYTTSQFSRVNQIECQKKTESVMLFFEGYEVPFEYIPIGLVEAQGDEYASNDEILSYLKYEAWKNCANAVINVKRGSQNREWGVTFAESDETDIYASTVFYGMAVTVNEEDLPWEVVNDTAFVQHVRADVEKQQNQTQSEVAGSVLGFIFGLVVLVLALNADSGE